MPAYCKLVLQLFVLVTATLAFSPSRQGRVSQIGSTSVPTARVLRWPVLLATPEEESASEAAPAVTQVSTPPPVAQEPEGTSYPLDIPSPILLSFSMILAIVGTGSSFDLFGGSPTLGFAPTAAIAVVTIPLCLFLFYASILKATAETEADDKEFMKGKY